MVTQPGTRSGSQRTLLLLLCYWLDLNKQRKGTFDGQLCVPQSGNPANHESKPTLAMTTRIVRLRVTNVKTSHLN